MDENWYTNESVWSLSFFYPDPQEDKKKKKKTLGPPQNWYKLEMLRFPQAASLDEMISAIYRTE